MQAAVVFGWLLLLGVCAFCDASPRQNAWGWWYNNGAPLPKERRINIVCQMLTNGGNVGATALFVKCCTKTVYRWWGRFLTTGGVEVLGGKRGPQPAIGPSALLYLLAITELKRTLSLYEYCVRLKHDIGLEVSEFRVCAALKALGLHRKKPSLKKIEATTPHARLLRQRYFLTLLLNRVTYGVGAIHRYVMIDEMYLNYDDTRAAKARARNGEDAVVLDYDTRGDKFGQLAAVSTAGFFAQYCYPCKYRSTTRVLFEWWLVNILMPALAPGQIVVMDRAQFHDPQRTAAFLSLVGCGLLMLAPYDSARNAIEYVHHIEKCYLRRNVPMARAFPMSSLYTVGGMITPVQCANIMHHVVGF